MTITNGYCTLAELQDWSDFAVPSQQNNQEAVVTAVSRWIEQYTQRHFWQDGDDSPVARVFDTCDPYVVDLGPFNDLVSITALKTDQGNDGTYETTWDTTDYQPAPVNTTGPEQRPYTQVRAVLGRTFPSPDRRAGRIQITGVWGWPAVPQAVTQACLIQTARVLKRRQAPEGVVGFADLGVVRMQPRLDADVQALLDPYRHPNTAVLVG